MRRVIRRFPVVLAAASMLALLVGCVSIPTSGPVSVGQTLTEQDSGIDFFPLTPLEGASQEEIARGFVAAFTGSADNYGVARQFLSSDFADDWNPRSNVTVRTGAESFSPLDTQTVEYSINAEATVDSSGAYRQNSQPVPLTLPFGFVLEDDEWRISAANDGIVLSEATFRSLFDKHALYFLDLTNDHLVPDLRWFPSGSATIRIVAALLNGPPDWLRGAVRTAFPDGTKLDGPSVEVEGGVALINLSPDALGASGSERRLMLRQLTESLANVANIRQVSVSVSGTPLTVSGIPASEPQADPPVDDRALVLKDGEFGYLVGDTVTTIGQLSAKVAELAPVGATMAGGAGSVALLGPSGVSVVRSGDTPTLLLDTRPGLVVPSIDADNFVWSASRSNPAALQVFSPSGAVVTIPTDLPADAELVSLDVARDGARIAILLSTADGPRLVVKAINRDGNRDRLPVSLSAAVLDATTQSGVASDATWIDDLSIAVLSESGGNETGSIVLYEVGGEWTTLGQPGAAVAIVGGNGSIGLRGLSGAGTVLGRSGNGWTDTGIVVSFLATQQ